MDNGKPKIVLSGQYRKIGHVPVDEAKKLAFEYAIKIIRASKN